MEKGNSNVTEPHQGYPGNGSAEGYILSHTLAQWSTLHGISERQNRRCRYRLNKAIKVCITQNARPNNKKNNNKLIN